MATSSTSTKKYTVALCVRKGSQVLFNTIGSFGMDQSMQNIFKNLITRGLKGTEVVKVEVAERENGPWWEIEDVFPFVVYLN